MSSESIIIKSHSMTLLFCCTCSRYARWFM